jgi:hypothetical protein
MGWEGMLLRQFYAARLLQLHRAAAKDPGLKTMQPRTWHSVSW